MNERESTGGQEKQNAGCNDFYLPAASTLQAWLYSLDATVEQAAVRGKTGSVIELRELYSFLLSLPVQCRRQRVGVKPDQQLES